MARLQDFQQVTPADSDNLLIVQATGQGLATVGSMFGTKVDKVNPTATGSLSLNRKAQTGIGLYSTAEGYNSEASGSGSHAEGDNTIANHNSQHVFGTYNLADPSGELPTAKGNYVEIVGNGASTNSRSNARTLDWSGNEVLAGDLTIKGSKSVNTFMTPTADYITPNLSGDLTYGTRIVYKSGGICVINLYAAISTPIAGTNYLLGTLPQGFRPSADTIMLCAGVYGGTSSAWRCNIGTDGKIITSSGSNTFTGGITVAGAFVCAQ